MIDSSLVAVRPTPFAPGPSRPRVRVDELGQCKPPLRPGPHAHEFFVLCYFPEAASWHEIGGARDGTRAGDVLTIPPGLPHDFAQDANEGAVAISFMADGVSPGLPGGAFKSRDRHPGEGRRLSVPPRERAQFHGLIVRLRDELRGERAGYKAAARALLALILVSTGRLCAPAAGGPAADPVLEDVFDLIEAQFRRPLSLGEIAATVARSPRHLSRTVRKRTGESVMQLIDDRRMEEARRLLLETPEKIEVIAEEVGFPDGGYFRRRFGRAHGVPPSTWRRLNR